ncbi:hypothetical protein QWU86_11185, partial [Neisseria gonorrhoeae]
VDKQVGKIIWSTKEAPDAWKMRAELWASDDFVRQYPDVTQLVATAYVRAAYWISQAQNRDVFIKILSASGQPENVVRREYVDVNSLLAPQFVNNALKELKLEHYWDASATTNVANR